MSGEQSCPSMFVTVQVSKISLVKSGIDAILSPHDNASTSTSRTLGAHPACCPGLYPDTKTRRFSEAECEIFELEPQHGRPSFREIQGGRSKPGCYSPPLKRYSRACGPARALCKPDTWLTFRTAVEHRNSRDKYLLLSPLQRSPSGRPSALAPRNP